MTDKTYQLYIKWLRAAYLYYIDPNGFDTGMHDLEWDRIAREFYAKKDSLPEDKYQVLHDPKYTGGSLFWLRADGYPEEVKKGMSDTIPCQNAERMGEFACANRDQCWEPCGELGNREEFAAPYVPDCGLPSSPMVGLIEEVRELIDSAPKNNTLTE